MSDALFDIALEPLCTPDLNCETGRCIDCHRPVKGRFSRYAQGMSEDGFWVQCDDCNPLGRLPQYGAQGDAA